MEISFPCPKCGKPYDLPWSLAGKKARCKRCEVEFVIPAPFEPKGPKSSEAIPVYDPMAAARASAGRRPIKAQDPPPNELLVGLRTGRKPVRTVKREALPPSSLEPEGRPSPQPPQPLEQRGPRPDDPLVPSKPGSPRSLERSGPRRESPRSEADPPDDPKAPSQRPSWVIPAIIVADLAIILVNVGLISSLVGGGDDDDDDDPPVKAAPVKPPIRRKPRVEDFPEPVATPREGDEADDPPARTRKLTKP
jgi:hypothetical protein